MPKDTTTAYSTRSASARRQRFREGRSNGDRRVGDRSNHEIASAPLAGFAFNGEGDNSTIATDPVNLEDSSDIEPPASTRDSSPSQENNDRSKLLSIIERLNRQLKSNKASAKRMKDKAKDLKERLTELEEELEGKDSEIKRLEKSELQYRNWWLNEIQFTKLLLNKIPDPNRDIDLVRTSQAHYLGHY
ncbi:hypothetical protein BKA70DRAFT_1238172 [Coprinopsis sp. MPI-PUGE-AT-0042]|nr:hypothetical protein BKA70DRAFT_1238172 [Coprinopsis sp. MPI-PUGE-AT-0042]